MGDINYPLLKEMINCADREISLRFAVYPKRIREGKMEKKPQTEKLSLCS